MSDNFGLAALSGAMHILRTLVNRGLVSPAEVETIHETLLEVVQGGDEQSAARFEAVFESSFVELRRFASDLWQEPDNPK